MQWREAVENIDEKTVAHANLGRVNYIIYTNVNPKLLEMDAWATTEHCDVSKFMERFEKYNLPLNFDIVDRKKWEQELSFIEKLDK